MRLFKHKFTLAAAIFLMGHCAAAEVDLDARQLLQSTSPWEFVGGNWSLEDGRLSQQDHTGQAYAYYRNATFADACVEMRFRVRPAGSGVQTAGIVLRSRDSENAYFVHYDTKNDQVILFRGNLLRDASELTRQRNIVMETDRWYTARASVQGDEIHVSLDGRVVLTSRDNTHAAGRVGVYTSQGSVDFEGLHVTGREVALSEPWKVVPFVQEVPRDQSVATILEIKVLCKQPGKYIGWPSIAQAPNGDLLAVFSGDRAAHVSPDGKTQMVRGTDGGKTWGAPVTIHDFPIDDRDAGIVRSEHGTMLVSWFTGPPYGTQLQGNYVIRSEDNGHTWGQPIRTPVTTPHGPIQLSDGRLLYIGLQPHCSHTTPRNYNGPPADSPHTVDIADSRDDGRSWKVISRFPVPADAKMLSFDEPHLVEVEDGKLVALFRDCNPPDRLRQSESTDGGLTWSTPHTTPVQGHPPHVIRLSNGWLLVVYGRRRPPFGEYACISRDGGRTWDVDNEIHLASAPNGDLGYPASVQLEDGSIWTVYYQIDRPGEKPCLMGTHWRLKKSD